MSTVRQDFDASRNLLLLGDRRLVFHCHHYNLFLQRSIEDGLGPEEAMRLQMSAAMESARHILSGQLAIDPAMNLADKLVLAQRIFATLGFGLADASTLTARGGRVRLLTSHYAIGWLAKWGTAKRPVCHFPVGFWMGALCAAAQLPPERLQGRELSCHAQGDAHCELEIEVL